MKNNAFKLVELLNEKNMTISTAESLTGGLLAGTIVSVPGASNVFNEGYITYSNEAKARIFGVSKEDLDNFSAVSKEVCMAMCIGAKNNAYSDIGVSTTGIAGPDGGTKETPVGTVFIGVSFNGKTVAERYCFTGDRQEVRIKTVEYAIDMVIDTLLK